MRRILILSICFFIAGYVQAQEPVVFRVKKAGHNICITPEEDILSAQTPNTICITADYDIQIAKVELPGAVVKKLKDNCYSITIDGNTNKNALKARSTENAVKGDTVASNRDLIFTVSSSNLTGNVNSSNWVGNVRVLSVYEFLPDGTIKLALRKTYRIPNSVTVQGADIEMD